MKRLLATLLLSTAVTTSYALCMEDDNALQAPTIPHAESANVVEMLKARAALNAYLADAESRLANCSVEDRAGLSASSLRALTEELDREMISFKRIQNRDLVAMR